MSQSVAHHVVRQGNQSVPVVVVEATEIEAHARCTQQHVHSVASKQKSHSSHEVINRYTAEIATAPKKYQDKLVDLVSTFAIWRISHSIELNTRLLELCIEECKLLLLGICCRLRVKR